MFADSKIDYNLFTVEPKIALPTVHLIRQDGTTANFPDELDDGKPILLTFIYTTCKGVCPIMSHVMKNVQSKLGDHVSDIHMVSISLDPDYDTPERLTEYASKMNAGPQWIHYTGHNSDIVAIEKAFNIYRGDKMNHLTVFFVRRSQSEPWLRFLGFVNPDTLIQSLGYDFNSSTDNH